MSAGIPLAWRQLAMEKKRTAAATTGILFAVVMMLVQLGFQDALMTSAVVHFQAMNCDILLASPQYQYLLQPAAFPERRLYQAAADARVESIAPVYVAALQWKNPENGQQRMILVLGAPPRPGVFALPAINRHIAELENPDLILFDAKGRDDYGPVPEKMRQGRRVETEVANRRVTVAGLFEIGTSFGVDGTLIVSDLTFFRLAPLLNRGAVALGLIKLKPGQAAIPVREALERSLPPDVRAYTRQEFMRHEQDYWTTNTPVGFLFKVGVGMGLSVGLIIVYQILYNDVMQHLKEYATLKAIGYSDLYLAGVVMRQGCILSLLGFLPGAVLSVFIYRFTAKATLLPLEMTAGRMIAVYAMTLTMCLAAAALAIRPVRKVDPAEIL